MIKKLLVVSVLLTAAFPVMAATDLPFVGTRYYNFMGGSGTGESIHIHKNGTTTIKMHGKSSTEITYQGRYQKKIPIYDNENYLMMIGTKAITLLDDKGEQSFGCSGEETVACVEFLYD